jgi:acetyl-CoA carboxylase biotin carboxyl carrier protein
MFVEVAVGVWSGSLALLADAGHMLADAGALALALVAQRFAALPRTPQSTFGLRRAEVLAAFVNGIALAVAALWVVTEAVERWVHPVEIRGAGLVAAAAAGLGVNLVVASILRRAGAASLNVRAALAHVMTDALGSLGALAAGVLVVAFGVRRADPALSVFIAALVAWALAARPAAAAEDAHVFFVTSPFVGTFYRAPSPDVAPFVEVGQVVHKGQALCIVEAMKLMNEIEAENDAAILEVLVENGASVEYGHKLFKARRNSPD